MVHVLLHGMSGLHRLFQDVCMFACALLLALDRLVYVFHVLILMSILVLNCEVL